MKLIYFAILTAQLYDYLQTFIVQSIKMFIKSHIENNTE